MKPLKWVNSIGGLFACAALLACNPGDEKVFKGEGNAESKPAAVSIEGLLGSDLTKAEAREAASVTYNMRIISNSGAELCNGETTLVIMTDFSLKVPNGKIQCVSLAVDLAGMLGSGVGLAGGGEKGGEENLTHDGKVLSLREIAGATFDPPRPFLLGPIVQDADNYKDFSRDTDHTLTAKDPDTGAEITGRGSFKIKVLDNKTTYYNEHIDETFKNILHWQMTTSGFDDIAAKNGLIFEKWEWLWNTRPIMIPSVTIVGRLSDFISSEGGGEDQIVGKITVKLVVKEYDVKSSADLR